jgi:hypothetical protein
MKRAPVLLAVLAVATPAAADDLRSIEDLRMEGVSAPSPAARHDPGCTSGQDDCDLGSEQFAGSVILGRAPVRFGHVGVVATGWGMAFRDQRVDVSQGIGALGVRAWVLPSVWLQWGVGAAHAGVSSDARELDLGYASLLPAAMAGIGVELGVFEDLDVALSVHGGSALDRDGAPSVYHVSFGLDVHY